VSIDADLYDPIYNGLKYFYPRLKQGGYIFIHDYNNDSYKGAKEAVRFFCKENNLPYFPLPDAAGSAIIAK
jgi:O-methyltransferase